MSEPIEEFMDGAYRRLRGEPRRARRLLEESAEHLHESADGLVATGLSRLDAEREAVRRFGSVDPIASSLRRFTMRRLVAESLPALTILTGIGLGAVGLSGAVAALMSHMFGTSFVGGLPRTYPGSVCRHYLAVQPSAGACARAAVLENSQDAVSLRMLAGTVGLVMLLAMWAWRRRHPVSGQAGRMLPTVAVSGTAAVALLGAAVLLLGQSIDMVVQTGSRGVGFYLSGGLAALVVGAMLALRAARSLLHDGVAAR